VFNNILLHCAKKVRDIVEFFEILRKIKKKSQQSHHGSFLYQICVKELLFFLHFLLNSFLMKCYLNRIIIYLNLCVMYGCTVLFLPNMERRSHLSEFEVNKAIGMLEGGPAKQK
jgi:hypothetical protein